MTAVCSDVEILGNSKIISGISRDEEGRERPTPPYDLRSATLDDLLEEEADFIQRSASSGTVVASLIGAIRFLSSHNAIWVNIYPEPTEALIRTEMTFSDDASPKIGRLESIWKAIGLMSSSQQHVAEEALTTRSYHFDLDWLPSTYLYSVSVDLLPTSRGSRRVGLSSLQRSRNPTIKWQGFGTSSAHLYTRDLDSIKVIEPKDMGGKHGSSLLPVISFRFKERPPGSLFWIAAFAWYLVVVAWICGANYLAIFSGSGEGLDPGWSALIFGLPGIAAAILVAKFTSNDVEATTAAVVLTVAWSVANALVMVCTAALMSIGNLQIDWNGKVPTPFGSIGVYSDGVLSIPWTLLMVSCSLNAAVATILLGRSYWGYWTRMAMH